MRAAARAIFGARGQLAVGIVCFLVAIGVWAYYTFVATPTLGAIFHISMFFGVAACYAIIATALGYRATERVEAQVADIDANEVEVDADEVNLT